jgi:hypothetical protein
MLTGYLVPGPDASGAQVNAVIRPIDLNSRRLNVRKPGPAGMLLGMAYPVAEAQAFSTHITFDCQFRTSYV